MLLGLTVKKDIGVVDQSGRPCHFIEVSMKAPRLLLSDAHARGLGVTWRAGWSILMAEPSYIDNLDSITLATLNVHAHKYHPLALSAYMGYLFDSPLPGDRLDTQSTIIENTRSLAARLPVPILLENAPPGPGDAPPWSLDPAFIWQTIASSGCGMVLNLAHAIVNAEHLQQKFERYVDQLPLDKVEQIRVSGLRHSESRGALFNAKDTLTKRELDALRYVLERSHPKAIILDFDSDNPTAVQDQLSLIREIAGIPARTGTTNQ